MSHPSHHADGTENDTAMRAVAAVHELYRSISYERQVSESSREIATRMLAEKRANPKYLKRILLFLSMAHKTGVITKEEKSRLKTELMRHGVAHVENTVLELPGARHLLRDIDKRVMSTRKKGVSGSELNNSVITDEELARTIAYSARDGSVVDHHIFTASGYTIKMSPSDSLLLQRAMLFSSDLLDSSSSSSSWSPIASHVVTPGEERVAPRKPVAPILVESTTLISFDEAIIPPSLKSGTRRILNSKNAGGNSVQSEALSFEFLFASVFRDFCEEDSVVCETQVEYKTRHTSIVDYVCDVGNGRARIGVSVTRAMNNLKRFDENDAFRLLEKKLNGLRRAERNVCDHHSFHRSVLHVWAESEEAARIVSNVYRERFRELVADREEDEDEEGKRFEPVVVLTVCNDLYRVVFDNENIQEVASLSRLSEDSSLNAEGFSPKPLERRELIKKKRSAGGDEEGRDDEDKGKSSHVFSSFEEAKQRWMEEEKEKARRREREKEEAAARRRRAMDRLTKYLSSTSLS